MSVIADVRNSLRSVRSRFATAAITVVTIALVVGAGSAILSMIGATLARPLPYADADRLVWVYSQPPGAGGAARHYALHSTSYVRFNERVRLLDQIAGYWGKARAMRSGDRVESVSTGAVSANYFAVLGLKTAAGRMFTDAEDVADAHVAVLGHDFWRFAPHASIRRSRSAASRASARYVGAGPGGISQFRRDTGTWFAT